ncbi:MAG TPA: hypothetical protein VHU85_05020 [Acidimicrobiales bacterium]|nr:hypothetical protein [Acidimicrobiales bacterium]
MIGDQGGHDTLASDVGGDPACWLHQVCDRCGALVAGDVEHDCAARPATSADEAEA